MRVTMVMFVGGLAFAATLAQGAAEVSTTGSAPKQTRADASSQSGHEAKVDSTDAQAANAWREYQAGMLTSLARGTSPRDWALARLLASTLYSANEQARQAVDKLPNAGEAWPDDVLVQWMTLRASRKTSEQDAALRALERLEPDNAAVWLWALQRANAGKDKPAIEAAMAHMAAAMRYNNHRADFLRMLLDLHQHYPLPPEFLGDTPVAGIKEDAPYSLAALEINVLFSDPYQALGSLCKIDPIDGTNMTYAAQCETIGRMLALHSHTVIDSRIGFAFLRASRRFGDQDVRSARDIDWVVQQYTALQNEMFAGMPDEEADSRVDPDRIAQAAANMRRLVVDQIETGSEIEAYRRALVRAGKALKPPGDWVDEQSPLSAARVRADEESMARVRKPAQMESSEPPPKPTH